MTTRLIPLVMGILAVISPGTSAQDAAATRDGARTVADPPPARLGDFPTPEVDRNVAISHALGMAIEGSGLWLAAPAVGGERVAGEGEAGVEAAVAPVVGDPMTTALRQHARDAFLASRRMFQAVRSEQGEFDRNRPDNFLQASWEYSRALEGLCQQGPAAGEAAIRPGSGAFAGQEARADAAVESAIGMPLPAVEIRRVMLINHAVKEVVQGASLRQMLRSHAAKDPASLALLSHADQMILSGRQTILSLNSDTEAGRVPGPEAGAGRAPTPANSASTSATGDTSARILSDVRAGNDDERLAAGVSHLAEPPRPNDRPGAMALVDQLARLGRQVVEAAQPFGGDNPELEPAPTERGSRVPDRGSR